MTTEILRLPDLNWAQAQKEAAVNQINRRIEAYMVRVRNRTTMAEPTTNLNQGDTFIIPPGATGTWSLYPGYIAHYYGSNWSFLYPTEGLSVWDLDAGERVIYLDGAWGVEPSQGGAHGIPAGGADGQVLTKTSGADYAVDWEEIPSPEVMGPSGANHAAGLAPDPGATAGTARYLREDGTWATPPDTNSGGTVTSVGLSMPNDFDVTNSPVTGSGTLTASYADRSANTVHAGPSSGAADTPTWRALVLDDIPDLSTLYAPASQPYVAGFMWNGKPSASQVMLRHTFALAVDFPQNLTNSGGYSETTGTTASTDFDIRRRTSGGTETSIGTVSFAAGSSTPTFTFGNAVTFSIGDTMRIVAPASPNSTFADFGVTLRGTR
jgi:hypothetical protein